MGGFDYNYLVFLINPLAQLCTTSLNDCKITINNQSFCCTMYTNYDIIMT